MRESRPGGGSTPEEQRAGLQGKLAGRKPARALLQQRAVVRPGIRRVCPRRVLIGHETVKEKSQNGPWGLWRPRKELTGLQAAQGENISQQPEYDPGDKGQAPAASDPCSQGGSPTLHPCSQVEEKTFRVNKTKSIIP